MAAQEGTGPGPNRPPGNQRPAKGRHGQLRGSGRRRSFKGTAACRDHGLEGRSRAQEVCLPVFYLVAQTGHGDEQRPNGNSGPVKESTRCHCLDVLARQLSLCGWYASEVVQCGLEVAKGLVDEKVRIKEAVRIGGGFVAIE